jgi:hypothetical protein
LILPFLEQAGIYDQINQEEPWNGPNNSIFTDTPIELYRSPRYAETGNTTNYVAIAGEGFIFNGDKRVRLTDLQDGSSSTILLVEIANSDIPWAEPRDLTLDDVQLEDAGADPGAVNVVRSMAVVGFADGSVSTIMTSDKEELRKMLTIAGSEVVNP